MNAPVHTRVKKMMSPIPKGDGWERDTYGSSVLYLPGRAACWLMRYIFLTGEAPSYKTFIELKSTSKILES